MKRFGIFVTFMLLVLAACEKESEPVRIEFASQSYQMNVGQIMDLTEELVVSNKSSKPSFSSSDENVVSVKRSGKATAHASGTAVITAELGGITASCTVCVSEIPAGKITLDCPRSLPADEIWATIVVETEPADFNKENLVWEFSANSDELAYETEKVSPSSYRVRFMTFVEGGSMTVKVSDRNSDMHDTAVIEVTEKQVAATKISLIMPFELSEGEVWASVIAEVKPEDYDPEHLVWEFEPTDDGLGFKSEKVSANEYKVCFSSYVEGGSVIVKVSDELSETFNQGRIKVVEKPVEGLVNLSVAPASLSLMIGDDPVTLQVAYEPADYDVSLLEWTSSDGEVATVDDGVVTVVGEGEAVIKVLDTISGKEASCTVTVNTPSEDASITRIDISQTSLNLRVGEDAAQLTATCYDANGKVVENYSGVEWTAEPMIGEDNREVVVVEVSQHGVVMPKNAGSTQVFVTDKKNPLAKAFCNVTVSAAEIKVESVMLEPSAKVIGIGETFAIAALVSPDNAENKGLTYSSSNEDVATVTAEGVVTGVVSGEAVITAKASNGVKGQCKVTVVDGAWVSLNASEITLVIGAEKTLIATVTPEDASDKTVTWVSSDSEVASVSEGTVKALKEGECVITAATSNGRTAGCKVIVESEAVEFDIALVPGEANLLTKGLMQDKTARINAQYTRKQDGKSYAPANVEWKSSDESVAVVDSDGNVTAVVEYIEKSGMENGRSVVITHTADGKEASLELVVVKAMPEEVIITSVPEVDGTPYRMMHGSTFRFTAKVIPEKADQHVDFMSSAYIAFLEDGVFYAKDPGHVDFIVYAGDDRSVKTSFSVEVLPIMITEAVISETSLNLNVGDEKYLTVEIYPENASYKTIEWTSSSEEVVEVSADGKVKAVAAGTATVTANLHGGVTASCNIVVSETTSGVKVGDFYYANGQTSSSAEEAGWGDIIGVVFSTKNPTLQDSGLDSACTHGLVLSLEETAGVMWQESSSNVGSWLEANAGYTGINDTQLECGYSNTLALQTFNEANASGKVVIAEYAPSVALPSGTSGWFIPSYAELMLVSNEYDAVAASLQTAGGTELSTYRAWINGTFDGYRYWSSTESPSSASWACSVQFHSDPTVRQGYTNAAKSKTHYRVRYIFAF